MKLFAITSFEGAGRSGTPEPRDRPAKADGDERSFLVIEFPPYGAVIAALSILKRRLNPRRPLLLRPFGYLAAGINAALKLLLKTERFRISHCLRLGASTTVITVHNVLTYPDNLAETSSIPSAKVGACLRDPISVSILKTFVRISQSEQANGLSGITRPFRARLRNQFRSAQTYGVGSRPFGLLVSSDAPACREACLSQ